MLSLSSSSYFFPSPNEYIEKSGVPSDIPFTAHRGNALESICYVLRRTFRFSRHPNIDFPHFQRQRSNSTKAWGNVTFLFMPDTLLLSCTKSMYGKGTRLLLRIHMYVTNTKTDRLKRIDGEKYNTTSQVPTLKAVFAVLCSSRLNTGLIRRGWATHRTVFHNCSLRTDAHRHLLWNICHLYPNF